MLLSASLNCVKFSVAKATLQPPLSTKDVVILKQGCGYIQKDVVIQHRCGYIQKDVVICHKSKHQNNLKSTKSTSQTPHLQPSYLTNSILTTVIKTILTTIITKIITNSLNHQCISFTLPLPSPQHTSHTPSPASSPTLSHTPSSFDFATFKLFSLFVLNS